MCDNLTLETQHDGFFRKVNKREINGKDCTTLYVFRPGRIENVLSDAGFSDEKVALFQMREGKFLKTKDSKRNYEIYTVNGTELKCIAVYYSDDTTNGCEFEDEYEKKDKDES